MKKFIFALSVVLLAVIASVGSSIAYEKWIVQPETGTFVSQAVSDSFQDYFSPVFSSSEEAMIYYDQAVDEHATDSIFVNIPRDVATNIITVVAGQNQQFDVKDIVLEYLHRYMSVYQYLRDSTNTNAPTEIQIDQQTRAVLPEPDSTQHDTVINGQIYNLKR